MKPEKLTDVIKKIRRLPTLPTIYSQLERIIADPSAPVSKVAAIIETDPSLSTTILRVANSAFYGFNDEIRSVGRAVVLLGANEIKHLAFAVTIMRYFKSKSKDDFDIVAFWHHSLATAVCAKVIATTAGSELIQYPEEAFTAGIIHDIGKIVAHQFMHPSFMRALQIAAHKRITISQAERLALGFTHAILGEALLIHWRLPPVLARAVRYHNTPDQYTEGVAFTMASVVHLADLFARALAIGSGGDPFIPAMCTQSWRRVGIHHNQIKAILDETEQAYSNLVSALPIPKCSS